MNLIGKICALQRAQLCQTSLGAGKSKIVSKNSYPRKSCRLTKNKTKPRPGQNKLHLETAKTGIYFYLVSIFTKYRTGSARFKSRTNFESSAQRPPKRFVSQPTSLKRDVLNGCPSEVLAICLFGARNTHPSKNTYALGWTK